MKLLVEAIEQAGYKPGDEIALALDAGRDRVLRRRHATSCTAKAGSFSAADMRRLPRRPCATATRSCRSRTAWPRTTGTAGPRSRKELGDRVQLVGDDLFVTNSERLARGIDTGVANSILVKVNQIGTLTETLDTVTLAMTQRLHLGDVAPQRRDRGHHDRRPRGRDRTAGRSRPARPRAATASRSTTSCCASRRSSARPPRTRAGGRSRPHAGAHRDRRHRERRRRVLRRAGRAPAPACGMGAADPDRGRVARGDRHHVPVRVPDPFVPRAAATGARRASRTSRCLKRAEQDAGRTRPRQLQTPSEIERLARTQFNMVLPGEQAYNVVPPATPVTATTTASLTRETARRGS